MDKKALIAVVVVVALLGGFFVYKGVSSGEGSLRSVIRKAPVRQQQVAPRTNVRVRNSQSNNVITQDEAGETDSIPQGPCAGMCTIQRQECDAGNIPNLDCAEAEASCLAQC